MAQGGELVGAREGVMGARVVGGDREQAMADDQRKEAEPRCLEPPGFGLARWGTLEGGLPWQSWADLLRAGATACVWTSARTGEDSK